MPSEPDDDNNTKQLRVDTSVDRRGVRFVSLGQRAWRITLTVAMETVTGGYHLTLLIANFQSFLKTRRFGLG